MPTDRYLNKIVLNKMTREQFENLTVKNLDEFYAVTDNTILGSISMFDTKISDHILEGDSARGWALQGSYVNGAVYSDFYAKCLEEYNEATNTETINGVTVKIHSNGHKFYNISDKTAIDEFFNSVGSAWFYGVDIENERVFLPRNNYFDQLTGDVSQVGDSVKAGLPNITGSLNSSNLNVQGYYREPKGAFQTLNGSRGTFNAGETSSEFYNGLSFDASLSNPIYGNSNTVQPNAVKKLLYICVGNTIVNEDQIDVSKVLSEAVLRSSLEQVQVVVETYSNGTSWYRIWSDGWCEQGGRSQCGSNINQTLTLLKDFANTNYTIQTTVDISNVTSGYNADAFIGSKTTSTVIIYCKNGSGGVLGTSYSFYWQASGYIW